MEYQTLGPSDPVYYIEDCQICDPKGSAGSPFGYTPIHIKLLTQEKVQYQAIATTYALDQIIA